MPANVVITLTGPDRVGIVEEVTRALLEVDGNVESSRMARLGGEFAIIALVALPTGADTQVEAALESLTAAGYRVTVSRTESGPGVAEAGWRPYKIAVQGADHEGIIHEIAAGLSRNGITIESMETGVAQAPVSGSLLFWMTALVAAPPEVLEADWTAKLRHAAEQSGVDVDVASTGAL
jgi:glycine cleavage system transcriptional repressor